VNNFRRSLFSLTSHKFYTPPWLDPRHLILGGFPSEGPGEIEGPALISNAYVPTTTDGSREDPTENYDLLVLVPEDPEARSMNWPSTPEMKAPLRVTRRLNDGHQRTVLRMQLGNSSKEA
jgi:hypothetical protein